MFKANENVILTENGKRLVILLGQSGVPAVPLTYLILTEGKQISKTFLFIHINIVIFPLLLSASYLAL